MHNPSGFVFAAKIWNNLAARFFGMRNCIFLSLEIAGYFQFYKHTIIDTFVYFSGIKVPDEFFARIVFRLTRYRFGGLCLGSGRFLRRYGRFRPRGFRSFLIRELYG